MERMTVFQLLDSLADADTIVTIITPTYFECNRFPYDGFGFCEYDDFLVSSFTWYAGNRLNIFLDGHGEKGGDA